MRPAHWLLPIAFVGFGCHSTAKKAVVAASPSVALPAQSPPPELPDAKITPFEPDYKTLPLLDTKTATTLDRKPPKGI
jgi:hypothetical protein